MNDESLPKRPTDTAAQRLERLEPLSCAARVRRLLPQIESALAHGASHKQVLETLHASGIEMSLRTFRDALYAARKRARRQPRNAGNATPTTGIAPTSAGAPPKPAAAPGGRDPLAPALPPKKTFQWDPLERPNFDFVDDDDDKPPS